ncbi:energy-coupled thiamine transporter ThiT [Bacillus sp. CLL-7-23]|uniref:Energy-coupled thiamine transporter ThiT n=1 Tax=Bacillus changyiensis TaxID=3004103 RepID=A0ABT4X8I0_9BACI|nr:energy-coupled thiamine transporter ThiT [Bacillus changyiensis]MDA1476156.1 energy-coupled thiamine transporter ThiT [Bacillus changyiensis]MDA7028538.1 energy-coupled thiamine transporter ThiT [Bacillus changyiensis]
MNHSKQLVQLIEIAMMTGIAIILDTISGMFLKMPQGGSIAIMMIPIFLISFRRGVKAGLTTGFLTGIMQFVTANLHVYQPIQVFLDYFIACTVIGMSGLFAGLIRKASLEKRTKKVMTYVAIGVFCGSFLKFLAHLISGVVFFGEYAPKGTPVWLYSFIYNGTYMLPSFVVCAVVSGLLLLTAPRLLQQR